MLGINGSVMCLDCDSVWTEYSTTALLNASVDSTGAPKYCFRPRSNIHFGAPVESTDEFNNAAYLTII